MNALAGVTLSKPTDWQAFERAMEILAQRHLNDPNAQLFGRGGQGQDGVDIVGHRNGDAKKRFAVQAKNWKKPVTAQDLEDEVAKAEKLEPLLVEFFLATTHERNKALREAADRLTAKFANAGRDFKIVVWSWDDITAIARRYADVEKAFDPTYSSFAEAEGEKTRAKISDDRDQILGAIAAIDAKLEVNLSRGSREASKDVIPDADEDTPLHGKITAWVDLINAGQAKVAETALRKALTDEWDDASATERYRLKAALAGTCIRQGVFDEGAELLREANQIDVYPEKIAVNNAKILLLDGDFEAAERAALEALKKYPDRDEACGILVQARANQRGDADPRDGLSDKQKALPEVHAGYIHWLRENNDEAWTTIAKEAAAEHPETKFLAVMAAEGALVDVTGNAQGYLGGAPAHRGAHDNLVAAAEALRSYVEEDLAAGAHVDVSTFHNATLALRLVEREEDALHIVREGRKRYAESEALRLQEALLTVGRKDFEDGLAALGEEPTELANRLFKAEILLNTKRTGEALKIIEDVEASDHPPPARRMIDSIRARAIAAADSPEAARQFLQERKKQHPDDLHLCALEISILSQLENRNAALVALESAIEKVNDDTEFIDVFELATEADNIEAYGAVVSLLSPRVSTDHLSAGLRMLMRAAVNGNYRKLLHETLENAPDFLKQTPFMTRVAAIFAINVGDPEAEAKVRAAVAANPADLDLMISLALFLHQKKNAVVMRTHLGNIECNRLRGRPEDFITLAQLFVMNGLPEKGAELGYAQLMSHWTSPSVHSRYHGLFFGADRNGNLVGDYDVVAIDTVVELETGDNARQLVLIDNDTFPAFSEARIDPTCEFAKALLGKKVGDEVHLGKDGPAKSFRILTIRHKWVFALQESADQFERKFPTSVGLRKFTMDMDGDDPLADIKEVSKAHAERINFVLSTYDENFMPHAMVAKNLGVDVVEAWIGHISEGRRFRVCAGTEEERSRAMALIHANGKRGAVVDAATASMIRRFELLMPVVETLGPLRMTASSVSVFEARIEELKFYEGREYMSLAWRDGGLQRTILNEDQVNVAIEARVDELNWVRENFNIVPAVPAKDPDTDWKSTFDALPAEAVDAAAAAQGQDLVFLCEDLGLRAWAEAAFDIAGVWLQPVLYRAHERNSMDTKPYAEAMLAMVKAGHHYVSLNTGALVEIANASDYRVTDDLKAVLAMIGGPTAHLGTNPGVVAGLIDAAVLQHGRSVRSMALASAVFDAMCKGRHPHKVQIVELILGAMKHQSQWIADHAARWIYGHSIGDPKLMAEIKKRLT